MSQVMHKTDKIHYGVLDGLRFISALWVVLSHQNVPQLHSLLGVFLSDDLATSVQTGYGLVFNGTLAVMVFFVISGFCIHLSHATGNPLNIPAFYLSRALRIGLPMLAAILLSKLFPQGYQEVKMVLWSLVCEIIYYAAYPLLLIAFRRFGFTACLSVSFAAALLLACFPDPAHGYFWAYGVPLTALLGLPVWILGALLAHWVKNETASPPFTAPSTVIQLRLLMLVIAVFTAYLHTHTTVTYKYTMLIFSPVCAFWVYAELVQKQPSKGFLHLATLGAGTYTLYLVHKIVVPMLTYFGLPNVGVFQVPVWLLVIALLSFVFYWLVEKPAHRLAAQAKKWTGATVAENVRVTHPSHLTFKHDNK